MENKYKYIQLDIPPPPPTATPGPPTECKNDVTKIFNLIKGKMVDKSKLIDPPINNEIPMGVSSWYKGIIKSIEGVDIEYGARYYNTMNQDIYYNIILEFSSTETGCINNPITSCDCIHAFILYPHLNDDIPQNIIDEAISILPTVSGSPSPSPSPTPPCGIGIWNGCTKGFPNKYLILAGALLAGWFILEGDD